MKLTLTILLAFTILGVTAFTTKTFADEKVLRHVVLFKFKDTATPGQIKQIEDAFRALPSQIPQVKSFEWGTNVSPESLAQGFTHCFLLTFSSDKDATPTWWPLRIRRSGNCSPRTLTKSPSSISGRSTDRLSRAR